MAALWLCFNEVFSSNSDLVCFVARIQSINSVKQILIVYDDERNETTSLHVSLANLRTSLSNLLPGQYVQIYGKIIRQGTEIIRIDAQLIRQLNIDFDFNEYVKGLILTRNYMANVDSGSIVVDIDT